MKQDYSSYDVKFLKNLSPEQITEIKKEYQELCNKLNSKDMFYDKYLKISKGDYSAFQSLLSDVNAKSFTQDEYNFLLRGYAIDRLSGVDIENSAALAVLLLGHEKFLKFVKSRLNIPEKIDSDDLDSAMRFGLRRAIDNFDFTQEYKFSTYAFEQVLGYAKAYIRDEYHKNNQYQNQSLEQSIFNDDMREKTLSLLDVLGVNDEFIASFADEDSAENILKQIGWFDIRTQFALFAKLNGMGVKEITEILKTSPTNYRLMIDGARQELRNIMADPDYIKEENFRDFVYKDGSTSKICKPYYKLTPEDFDEIVNARGVDGVLLKISKKLGKDMLSRKEFFDPLSDNAEIASVLGFFDEKIQFILMAMRQGMTAEEIAGVLNITKNTVMVDYWQARKELKNILCDPDYIKGGYKQFKRNSNLSFVRLPYHLLEMGDFDGILEQASKRPKKEKIDFLNDVRIDENLGYFEDKMQFIVMARREGLSNIEIAKILDMKPKTISELFAKLKAEFECIFTQPDYVTQGYKKANFRNGFSSIRHPYKRFTEQEFNDVLEGKLKFERHRKKGFADDEINIEMPEK